MLLVVLNELIHVKLLQQYKLNSAEMFNNISMIVILLLSLEKSIDLFTFCSRIPSWWWVSVTKCFI